MPPVEPAQSIAALFADSLQRYRRGELDAAANRLEALLRLSPGHFDALHLAGVIAAQQGRPQQAVDLLGQALARDGSVAAAHRHLGNALRDTGRHAQALESYDRAIALRADFRDAHVNRALLLLVLRRPAEALAAFDRAVALGAEEAAVHAFRASALIELGRPEEAIAACERVLQREPDHLVARVNRALALFRVRRYEAALADCERAIARDPAHGEALACRGATLYALRRIDEALASLEGVLQRQPHHPLAANIRALCLLERQRPAEALTTIDGVLALYPGQADAWNTRGLVLTDLRQFADAIASFERSATLQPGNPEPLFNKGLRHLQSGEYAPGWDLYEHRPLQRPGHVQPRSHRPRWDGTQDPAGRVILVYSEQGLGDTIQFCRYAPLLATHGARVILIVQDPLCALLRTLAPGITVLGSTSSLPDHDYVCPLLSLPRAFRTDAATIPAAVPYLHADSRRVARWRERLQGEGRLIGIRWQGSTGAADAGRSFPLALFESLATVPGVRLVSLQKGPGSEQLQHLTAGWRVLDLGEEFEPAGPDAFLDVAAVMQSLDLVISSDTSVAHLAGALARPAWIALKHVPDWRWLLDRDDSPWYPTLRLFRQERGGDWVGVFQRMRAALSSGGK